MAVETLKPTSSRFEKGSGRLLSVRRVSVVAPSGETDIDHQNLTLKIDGEEISIARKPFYTTSDVLLMVRSAKGLTDSYLISPLIKNIVDSKAVKADKVRVEGKMTYSFREQDLVILINTLLPRVDPYVSLPKGPIALPDGQRLNKLTDLLRKLIKLFIDRKNEGKKVTISDLATLYPDLPPEEARSRARSPLHTARAILQRCGWIIVNHTRRPDLIRGQKPEYELVRIPDSKHNRSTPPKERQGGAWNDLLRTDVLPGALSRQPPTKEAQEVREKAIASAKENLELECTTIILRHLKTEQNLEGFETDLFKFLTGNLIARWPYCMSLRDIIEFDKQEDFTHKLEKFFIDFLRKRLQEAAMVTNQIKLKSRLEREIEDIYLPMLLKSGKNASIESTIKIVCGHFEIRYNKPPKPATSSPAR
ncbi:MAG: hypothetical protein AAB662_02355 [Patescibacteria group bacterium]